MKIINVADLIKKLQTMPMDATVHLGVFDSFLSDFLEPVKPKSDKDIPNKESYDLFPLSCELKTVYCWSVRNQCFVTYSDVVVIEGD